MNNFTNFDKMITPTIIKILFLVGSACSIILGFISLFSGIAGGSGSGILFGLICIILGPVFTRIYCELLIIIFKINDTLNEINEKIDN
ncbi:MAG: DUF4282 domain-containing protein [Eubacteriales bacterium]